MTDCRLEYSHILTELAVPVLHTLKDKIRILFCKSASFLSVHHVRASYSLLAALQQIMGPPHMVVRA
jgi:hypothetical protein